MRTNPRMNRDPIRFRTTWPLAGIGTVRRVPPASYNAFTKSVENSQVFRWTNGGQPVG